MRLGSKVLLLLLFIWLISVSAFYIGTNEFFLKSVDSLEKTQIDKNIKRAQGALEQLASSYAATNLDWAHWNDLYSYIQTKNPSFIEQNILPGALDNINVDVIAFLNKNGEVVYGGMVEHDKIVALPIGLSAYFGSESTIIKKSNLINPIKSFIQIPSGILFVTANGISNSVITAPMNGVIVTGTFLSQDVMMQLSKSTETPMTLMKMSDIENNTVLGTALVHAVANKQSTFYLLKNDQYADGYLIISDISNKPIALINIKIYRYVSMTLQNSILYFMLFSVFIFVLSALAIWLIINKYVINRIERINQKIQSISDSHDYSTRVVDEGYDELGSLTTELNNMMKTITISQNSLITANMLTTQSEILFRHSFDYAAIGMAMVSPEGKFLKVNKALCRLVGYDESELLQMDFQSITYPEDLQSDLDLVNKSLSGQINKYQLQKRYIHKNGKLIWILLNVSLVRDLATDKPLYFIKQIQNINTQKMMEKKLVDMAFHDHLTNLANRKLLETSFIISLKYAQRNHKKLAICFLDLDNFKEANDQYGHETGDVLLKKIASRIKKHVRSTDILARLGGDEFVLVITEVDSIDAVMKTVKKIQEVVAKPYMIEGREFHITASIGVSIYPDHGENLQVLINNADKALYAVKKNGRNQYQLFSR